MDSLDDSYLLTGYEPKSYDHKETYVESYTESLTSIAQFSEQGFLEDVEYDDTALEEMLQNAHRVHVYHSQRKGLSVGQSSSSVSERTERSVAERTGRLVRPSGQELNVGNAQIRTLLDRQKERFSPNVRRILRNTNSRLTMTEEVYENWVKSLNLSKKNFIAQQRDQQLLHERLLQQNSELREAHHKSLNEMEELKKFQSSTFDTIARRRSVEDQNTIIGTFWQEYRNCKMK